MTPDPARPRLAAAADDALRAAFGAGSVTSDELADDARPAVLAALDPHVPERDELVAALWEWIDQTMADSLVAPGTAYAAGEVTAILARHAPEQTDV